MSAGRFFDTLDTRCLVWFSMWPSACSKDHRALGSASVSFATRTSNTFTVNMSLSLFLSFALNCSNLARNCLTNRICIRFDRTGLLLQDFRSQKGRGSGMPLRMHNVLGHLEINQLDNTLVPSYIIWFQTTEQHTNFLMKLQNCSINDTEY